MRVHVVRVPRVVGFFLLMVLGIFQRSPRPPKEET